MIKEPINNDKLFECFKIAFDYLKDAQIIKSELNQDTEDIITPMDRKMLASYTIAIYEKWQYTLKEYEQNKPKIKKD